MAQLKSSNSNLILLHFNQNLIFEINFVLQLKKNMKKSLTVLCIFIFRQTALHKYGKSPAIKLNGHIQAVFPYIQAPLDYIIPELLKNAVR